MENKMTDYMQVPEPITRRSGMKVSWNYYDNEETAKTAAEAAKHNGYIDQGRGYDFGYTFPGSIRPPSSDGKGFHAHLWEVCVF